MKRIKKIAAFLVASALLFGSAASVLAADLKLTDKSFVTIGSAPSGKIPVSGIGSIDSKIESAAKAFAGKFSAIIGEGYDNVTFSAPKITKGSDRYSKFEFTIGLLSDTKGVNNVAQVYFVDLQNNTEIASESAYNDAIAAEKKAAEDAAKAKEDAEKAEEEPAVEAAEQAGYGDDVLSTLVPLRANVEALGFTIDWFDEDGEQQKAPIGMDILKGDVVVASIFIDETLCLVGEDGAYELLAAPTLKDGSTAVPAEFFIKCLGALPVDDALSAFELDPAFKFVSNEGGEEGEEDAGAAAESSEKALFYDAKDDLKAAPGEFKENKNSGNLQKAGGPATAFTAGKGLKISNRSNDYDSVDLLFEKLADGEYTLEVEFTAEQTEKFQIACADRPWSALAEAEAKSAKLSYTFSVAGGIFKNEGGDQNRFRLRAASKTGTFYIKSVKLYK